MATCAFLVFFTQRQFALLTENRGGCMYHYINSQGVKRQWRKTGYVQSRAEETYE